MSEEPEYNPMTSPKRDLEKLGKNSQAVVGELRQFLATLKGKSPKEMMGAVADSSLAQSMLVATGITALLLVVLTGIPYALKDSKAETEEWEKLIWSKERKERSQEISTTFRNHNKAVREAINSALTQDGATSSSGQTGRQPNVGADEKASGSAQSTADKIGIGEEKKADPNSNPLDSKDDDLLDGLDDL